MVDRAKSGVTSDPAIDRERVVHPPESFVEQANVTEPLREQWAAEWPTRWREAATLLDWIEDYDEVLTAEQPPLEWFPGGTLNASANAIDRHVSGGRKNSVAIKWVGRRGETRTITYQELSREVNAVAAALRSVGVAEDEVVTLYLPMIPELPIAMLAAARIGAPHNVVFAGFSASALAARMDSTGSEHLVTCDGYYRRGEAVDQRGRADNARLQLDHELESVIVVNRLEEESGLAGHEFTYEELIAEHLGTTVEPVPRDSTDQLFSMHTSGTTGNPKRVRHTTGGYLAQVAWTARAILDLDPEDTIWATADIGWVTGHSYVVYGPLVLGATTLIYEGTPEYHESDQMWELIERNAVDIFYTAPTVVSAFMKRGTDFRERHDLSSLRLLGSVGERISPRAWHWYHSNVGSGEAPVVDTYWQTETGAVLISTIPGVDDMKPGAAGPPLPGIDAAVVDSGGNPLPAGSDGYLVIRSPWPAMPLELTRGEGWSREEHATDLVDSDEWLYVTEDRAVLDEDGYVTLLGRVDDVVNVAGRRLDTGRLESAVVGVEGVAEAAIVKPQTTPGPLHAFVSPETTGSVDLRRDVIGALTDLLGEDREVRVVFTPNLPKTRSGKIMRRFLEDITEGRHIDDTSALRNPEVIGELRSRVDREGSGE
ncbi:MAG: acetate--CoA ligase [Halodesulfurarchaeum sp.]